jgi:hypothetical protein
MGESRRKGLKEKEACNPRRGKKVDRSKDRGE